MEKEKLIELAKGVAGYRRDVALARFKEGNLEVLMLKTPAALEYKKQVAKVEALKENLEQAEFELKEAVLAHHRETEERKPIDKVEVKIFKTIKYKMDEALDWCKTNATSLLSLNKRAFEKTAEQIGAPVQVTEKPKCYLAQDMTIYLEEEVKEKTD